MACAEEPVGSVHPRSQDPLVAKHLSRDWENSVYQRTLQVLRQSDESGRTTHEVVFLAGQGIIT